MCRMAWEDGIRAIAATTHQNECYPDVTPARIREVALELVERLRREGIPLAIYPSAEVMVTPETEQSWQDGQLLSMADAGQYLLIELPNGLFLDLRDMVSELVRQGVRPILAHPERHRELLNGGNLIEELIRRGCVVQISAQSVVQDKYEWLTAGLRRWVKRGVVHLVGSDGHSTNRRPPLLSAAYRRLAAWGGSGFADRVCSANGMAILEGLPLETPRPRPARVRWPW